jgi:hypothetical protein
MNDFDLYLGEILHTYGQEEDARGKDRYQELLDILSKQYKHVKWTAQPFADEYLPPADGGEHDIEEHSEEMMPIDLIGHYLHEIFFHYKTKEEAEAMVKVRLELRPCLRRVARQVGALQLLLLRCHRAVSGHTGARRPCQAQADGEGGGGACGRTFRRAVRGGVRRYEGGDTGRRDQHRRRP